MDDPNIDGPDAAEVETTMDLPAAAIVVPVIVPSAIDEKSGVGFRVVDADTGETIKRVIEADSAAGMVKRYAVEDGNLVREDDHFVVIEEERAIRIEAIDA